MSRFEERWAPVFGRDGAAPARWWDDVLHLHDEVASEYDDGGDTQRSLQELVYSAARSEWLRRHPAFLETAVQRKRVLNHALFGFRCERCSLALEGSAVFECDQCVRDQEQDHLLAIAIREVRDYFHERWLANLSPEDRAAYEAQQVAQMRMICYGLIVRDVQ